MKPEWPMQPVPKPTRPESSKAKVQRRRAVKPVSDKRKEERAVYAAARLEFLQLHKMRCQAQLQGCSTVATEVHHRAGRVGSDYLDTATWLACCHSCHEVITQNPEAAYAHGWAEKRHGAG